MQTPSSSTNHQSQTPQCPFQTTDLKVNTVTPALFKLAPDAAEMAKLDPSVIAAIIKPLGLSATKSRHLQGLSQARASCFMEDSGSDSRVLLPEDPWPP